MLFKSDYKALMAKYDSLKKEFDDKDLLLIKANNQIEEYRNTIENAQSELTKKDVLIEDLKIQKSLVENSVNSRVNNALSVFGTNSFAVEQIQMVKAELPSEVLIKFESLQGDEKTNYYKMNKEVITKALEARTNKK